MRRSLLFVDNTERVDVEIEDFLFEVDLLPSYGDVMWGPCAGPGAGREITIKVVSRFENGDYVEADLDEAVYALGTTEEDLEEELAEKAEDLLINSTDHDDRHDW